MFPTSLSSEHMQLQSIFSLHLILIYSYGQLSSYICQLLSEQETAQRKSGTSGSYSSQENTV